MRALLALALAGCAGASSDPGLRAELWGQAGQAYVEAGAADKAAEAQSRAIELKGNDPDLWVDRGLSYAAMRAWPRAISDFDRALILKPNDVEILVYGTLAPYLDAVSPTHFVFPGQRVSGLFGPVRLRGSG